ncbi:MAG: glycerol-3-phosphate dehydrogenase/oxidase [Nitrososphaerota archaeon]
MNDKVIAERGKIIERLKSGVDVAVIGGGITGAGVLNVLSSTNLKVALFDANDFAFGTSSRSSKLIHGGLRYLANGQFSVVRDSVRERDFLLTFSNLVKKEDFFIPIDDNSWSRTELRLGLWIYSLFSKSIKAKWHSQDEIAEKFPALRNTPQKGGFVYSEGVVDDARLVMENILSAEQNGAIAFNYGEVVDINFEKDVATSIRVRDKILNLEFEVPVKMIINSTGPWVGKVLERISNKFSGISTMIKQIKLSKGTHIIVRKDIFPVNVALAIRSPVDKRQVFVIPRGDVVIIGTTEDFYNGDISNPEPTENEIKYLIESVKNYVKGISAKDIINSYAGLRPLFGSSKNLGKISREYKVVTTGNIINILGGKITTYRTVALKVSRIVSDHFKIKLLPNIKLTYSPDRTESKELCKAFSDDPEKAKFCREILFEHAYHIDDILWRREGAFIFSADSGVSLVDKCLEVMRLTLGYSTEELGIERERYMKLLQR